MLECITEVIAPEVIHDRWVVKTDFCQRDYSKANEQQRHLKEKPFSEYSMRRQSPFKPVKKYFLPLPTEMIIHP